MRDTITKVRDILPPSQRRYAVWLLIMSAVSALLEAAGVVSIVPFMMVASNPEILHQNNWLGQLYQVSGFSSDNHFLFLLGAITFVVLVAGNAFKALTSWLINRFTHLSGHEISMRLNRAYLAQPYEYFLTHHSADLGKNVLAEVQQVTSGVLRPGMTAITRLVAALCIAALLLATNPLIALVVVAVLGGAYGAIYGGTRLYLSRIGQERYSANRERFHVMSEAFAAVKDLKLKGSESAYAARYERPSLRFAQLQSANQSLSELPRYGLEVVAFGGILLIVLYLLIAHDGLGNALPIIALYAFAGYRMLPTLQEVFAGFAKMRFNKPALDRLHKDLMEKVPDLSSKDRPVDPLPFSKRILLDRIDYSYPSGNGPVLQNLSIEIPHGSRVAFIGQTGAGKSTIVDLILGLLIPTSRSVVVDETPLRDPETIRRWQRQIGYVPQHIFLADDTIAANIAFGVAPDAVDRASVEKAARIAQLHDYIVGELPEGYETRIGERGVRLSGGQRQRLGLARALYGDPAVLVLDEATSALDNETEALVIKALDGLGRDKTVIMIAHRLSTVSGCDILFRLEQGRVVASGTYDEVLGASSSQTQRGPTGGKSEGEVSRNTALSAGKSETSQPTSL